MSRIDHYRFRVTRYEVSTWLRKQPLDLLQPLQAWPPVHGVLDLHCIWTYVWPLDMAVLFKVDWQGSGWAYSISQYMRSRTLDILLQTIPKIYPHIPGSAFAIAYIFWSICNLLWTNDCNPLTPESEPFPFLRSWWPGSKRLTRN